MEGQLQEGRVALYSDRPEVLPLAPDADPAELIKRLRCVWQYSAPGDSSGGGGGGEGEAAPMLSAPTAAAPAGAAAVHEDAAWSLVLRAYAARIGTGSILLPVGGLGAVHRLAALSAGGHCLALVGDKAYAQEDELAGLRDPHVAVHGAVSFMANLHAARLHTLAAGGITLHTPFLDGFKVAALLLGGLQARGGRQRCTSHCTHVPCAPPLVQHSGSPPVRKHVSARPTPTASVAAPATPAELLDAAGTPLPPGAVAALPDTLLAWADAMDTFGPDNFVTLQVTGWLAAAAARLRGRVPPPLESSTTCRAAAALRTRRVQGRRRVAAACPRRRATRGVGCRRLPQIQGEHHRPQPVRLGAPRRRHGARRRADSRAALPAPAVQGRELRARARQHGAQTLRRRAGALLGEPAAVRRAPRCVS